jgi:hypothetical protein
LDAITVSTRESAGVSVLSSLPTSRSVIVRFGSGCDARTPRQKTAVPIVSGTHATTSARVALGCASRRPAVIPGRQPKAVAVMS